LLGPPGTRSDASGEDGLKVPDLLPSFLPSQNENLVIITNQNIIKMAAEERPYEPPAFTRAIHNVTMGTVGFICRSFLYGLSRTEVHGLEAFQKLVDERSDPERRERGLITGT
jgi:hypothetical protein